jgi:hypothetical protein
MTSITIPTPHEIAVFVFRNAFRSRFRAERKQHDARIVWTKAADGSIVSALRQAASASSG